MTNRQSTKLAEEKYKLNVEDLLQDDSSDEDQEMEQILQKTRNWVNWKSSVN